MNEHILVTIGKRKFEEGKARKEPYPFMHNYEEDCFLNDLKHYPHAIVLAGIMDTQIKAERAWHIPFFIKEKLGAFDIETLAKIPLKQYIELFEKNSLHRFNSRQAKFFYNAVHRIVDIYDGDISKTWKDKPSSAKVVYEFLQFDGVGIKIATMLANILARDLHVPFSDYYSIDISPDVHIMKIMRRTGLVENDADRDCVIYKARELCPEFPGIIDFACWEIGREWCKQTNPDCEHCPINDACEKRYGEEQA